MESGEMGIEAGPETPVSGNAGQWKRRSVETPVLVHERD
jgi:hypothetical protein